MKNIYLKLVIAFLSLGMLVGCNDYLEENPISEVLLTDLTEGNINAVLAGVYEPLTRSRGRIWESNFATALILLNESMVGRTGAFLSLSQYKISTSNRADDAWPTLYEAVGRANSLIVAVEGSNLSENIKNRAIGEAKFVRALVYYTLVRSYGKVPLRTEPLTDPSQSGLALSDESVIYNQIIADLKEAESKLPVKVANGRFGAATAGAAKVMLADVYLTLNQHALAASKAKEIIDNKEVYGYELLAKFPDVFSPTADTSTEEVFYLKFSQSIGLGNFQETRWAPRIGSYALDGGIAPRGLELGGINSKVSLIAGWSDNDTRKAWTMYKELPVGTGGAMINVVGSSNYDFLLGKYRDPGAFEETAGGVDWPLYRYADALLIFAEAENIAKGGPTADCYTAINQITERAYGNASGNFPAGLAMQQFDDLVFQERGYEFLGEGKRWFDIKRSGRINIIEQAQVAIKKGAAWAVPSEFVSPYYFRLPPDEINSNPGL